MRSWWVDPKRARHAVAYYDVEPAQLSSMLQSRREPLRSAALLAAHPKARARLMYGGVFWHRRHAEALLLTRGDQPRADDVLREAHGLCVQLEATPLLAAVRSLATGW